MNELNSRTEIRLQQDIIVDNGRYPMLNFDNKILLVARMVNILLLLQNWGYT